MALGKPDPVLDSLLERPSETVSPILVDGLEHGKCRADFEDGRSDEGGDSTGRLYLARELGLGSVERVPDEEPVDAPYYRTYCLSLAPGVQYELS
jgi:hypothetical protein